MRKLIGVVTSCMVIAGCGGKSVAPPGLTNGQLAACPGKPNCVISQGGDEGHRVDPIRYAGSRAEAVDRLKAILMARPRTRIVKATSDYLHAESTSALMRFVDDVEFFLPEKGGVIHVRSASRVGYSDFGVNRKRVEAIRAAFESAGGDSG
jgi:uncharacterized protein (DUF1499 family)